MTIRTLGHKRAARISRSIRRADDDARPHELREVYYLLRSRRPFYTTICLVHGSFFATVSTEQLLRDSLQQVIEDSVDAPAAISAVTVSILADLLARECFSDNLRSVHKASVDLKLGICAEVEQRTNILNRFYFPEIEIETINLVLPMRSAEDIAKRKRHLYQALSHIQVEQGRESTIKHPFNGDFFVLSYSL